MRERIKTRERRRGSTSRTGGFPSELMEEPRMRSKEEVVEWLKGMMGTLNVELNSEKCWDDAYGFFEKVMKVVNTLDKHKVKRELVDRMMGIIGRAAEEMPFFVACRVGRISIVMAKRGKRKEMMNIIRSLANGSVDTKIALARDLEKNVDELKKVFGKRQGKEIEEIWENLKEEVGWALKI